MTKISFLFGRPLKKILALVFLVGILFSQYAYDAHRLKNPPAQPETPSLDSVKTFDLGLHSAVAGYLWVTQTISELPFLKYGYEQFAKDFSLVNALDPRFSFPYYFTVLVLPNTRYPGRVDASIAIGERGVREADPNWRVDFYLATLYHLEKNDRLNAAKYFDLAATAPDAPFYIKRFSINYGIAPNVREQTRRVWQAIAENTKDDEIKARAENYVKRLDEFDFLELSARVYKKKYGKLPEKIGDLIKGGILNAIPPDPFGFEFFIYPDGTVGIVK